MERRRRRLRYEPSEVARGSAPGACGDGGGERSRSGADGPGTCRGTETNSSVETEEVAEDEARVGLRPTSRCAYCAGIGGSGGKDSSVLLPG